MGNNGNKIEYKCKMCGTALTDENSFERVFGISDYCADCEEKQFTELERINGSHLALFIMCGRVNIPLLPLILPSNWATFENKWTIYNDLLIENDKLFDGERYRTFSDGENNIRKIFGREMTESDFAKYIAYEQSQQEKKRQEKEKEEKISGTDEQKRFWGTDDIWKDMPMNAKIYDELDVMYKNQISAFKGISLSEKTKDTIKEIVKLRKVQNILRGKGKAKSIVDLQHAIDSLESAEQLRKKDEKPIEAMRVDALIIALEKKGIDMSLLTYDELQEVLFGSFIKKKKYKYTKDVADQMIEIMYNTMRENSDLLPETELPTSMQVNDTYGEFEAEESEREKEAKRYAELTKVQFVDKKETADVEEDE